MIKALTIISLLIFTSTSYASCPKDAQYFKKGEVTNCDVYAFSPEKHQEIIIKVKSYDLLQTYSDTQEVLIDNKTKQIENLNKLLQIKETKEKYSDLEKVAYFLGGITVMYFASKAAQGL